MTKVQEFPAHPFWDYSLQLYSQTGVADACLLLQDEFALDVNIVLFCVWSGAAGPGPLDEAAIRNAIARTASWQAEVVSRLRTIRRKLKTDDLGAGAGSTALFRPRVQALEIDAEHVEQLMLADLAPATRGSNGPQIAIANLKTYLRAAGIVPEGGAGVPARQILMRAFDSLTPAEIDQRWRATD